MLSSCQFQTNNCQNIWISFILTSQHICGDEPLEGFDLERNCWDKGGGREQEDQGLHCEDQRHSTKWGLAWSPINCVNRQHLYNFCLHRPVWSEQRSESWLRWSVRTATGYIAPWHQESRWHIADWSTSDTGTESSWAHWTADWIHHFTGLVLVLHIYIHGSLNKKFHPKKLWRTI